MAPRRESAGLSAFVASSRSAIRVVAAVVALFGLILMFNEVLEQTVLCDVGACDRIHLSPMAWGLTLTVLGCLILQKGDVSVSLQEITVAYERVRTATFPGRRTEDRKSATPIVITETTETTVSAAPALDPAAPIDAEKDERVERPRFPLGRD